MHLVRLVNLLWPFFALKYRFPSVRDGRTDGRTDRPTDRRIDRPTDGWTDPPTDRRRDPGIEIREGASKNGRQNKNKNKHEKSTESEVTDLPPLGTFEFDAVPRLFLASAARRKILADSRLIG